jgi:YD repeat-containing protein
MTTTRTVRRLVAFMALALALSMTWSTAGPAQAAHPDRVPAARHRILGQHLTNHHTHMETWIVGWFSYERRVRIHHHWRRKTFYGLQVSAQHCTTRRCWGPVVGGRLWSPHQPGRPLRGATRGSEVLAGDGDLCIQGTTACAAPWNWFAGFIDERQQNLVRLFVDPCGAGSLAGGGVVLSKNLSARILFEGGVITAARAASAFEGPPGVALGALGGCMTGVAAKGLRTVSGLLDHLNPLDRGVTPRG